MTTTTLQPGCYGSALFYSVNDTDCVACPSFAACGPLAKERQPIALQFVLKLDRVFLSERAQDVARRFKRSHVRNVTQERSAKLSGAFLTRLSDDGVNVYHLKHGTNPVTEPGAFLHDLFAFMLDAKTFKPADAVEHLRTIRDDTKALLTRRVKEVCDALLFAGILKKERHVLCL